MLTIAATVSAGSPPQVRGKLLHRWAVCRTKRITPAGAGKTPYGATICPKLQDHPRRCGENVHHVRKLTFPAGSPPQVRGKPDRVLAKSEQIRITPAGAGKTFVFKHRFPPSKDHPRRCGENICA